MELNSFPLWTFTSIIKKPFETTFWMLIQHHQLGDILASWTMHHHTSSLIRYIRYMSFVLFGTVSQCCDATSILIRFFRTSLYDRRPNWGCRKFNICLEKCSSLPTLSRCLEVSWKWLLHFGSTFAKRTWLSPCMKNTQNSSVIATQLTFVLKVAAHVQSARWS